MGKMEKTAMSSLREQIVVLESRRALEEIEIRNEFKKVHEVLKPSNLIHSAIKDLSSSPELKSNVMNFVIGMAAGFLSKKAAIGSSSNPIKLVLGNILENVVSTGVSNNTDAIKSTIVSLIQKFTKKEDKPSQEEKTPNDERN